MSACLAAFLQRIPVADGFFKPRPPIKKGAVGAKPSALLPMSRPHVGSSGVRVPWFVLGAEGEAEADGLRGEQFGTTSQEDEEQGQEHGEGEERVGTSDIEPPEMMSEEVSCVNLFVSQGVRLCVLGGVLYSIACCATFLLMGKRQKPY